MNKELTNQIIRHVYSCLGVRLPNKKTNVQSIMQPEYLFDKKISFDDGVKNNIWGIEFNFSKSEDLYFQIILAELTQDNVQEYAILVCAKDSPSYGCYLTYDEYNLDAEVAVDRPMIACNLQKGSWAECSVYLQSSFLCGMEKIREVSSSFKKIKNENLYEQLISFIQFYQNTMEKENEGKESR
jgi:hypothetical protein